MSTLGRIAVILACCGAASACDGLLDEQVYSELPPDRSLATGRGINSLLVAAYGELSFVAAGQRNVQITMEELTTDILVETGGALERDVRPFMDFTWDPSHRYLRDFWAECYRAIRNANMVLDHLETAEVTPAERAEFEAEARFIRAKAYFELYNLFGPVPLITAPRIRSEGVARATDEQMRVFVATELRSAAARLPLIAEQYGRATKGAALAFLTKFLLNTRQWEGAAEAAQAVIDLGVYRLVDDRHAMFEVANERNTEFIHVSPALPSTGAGGIYFAHVVPPGYVFRYPPKADFGAEFRTPWWLIASFHPDDERRRHFLTRHVDSRGELIDFAPRYGYSHKYPEDPDSRGSSAGNDIVELRLADILLSRAEALNELEGPSQQAIDLLNEVRRVAGVPQLGPADFPSGESFRDHLLRERAWELFTEGKRRQDLIRHGVFVDRARARGHPAQPHHVLFPIPQAEMDANPNLRQNPGY